MFQMPQMQREEPLKRQNQKLWWDPMPLQTLKRAMIIPKHI